MNNNDWIKYHEGLGDNETESAKYNGFKFEKSTRAYRQHIRRVIEGFAPRNIMDLCCGSGDVTGPLTNKFKVFGVDAVEKSCVLATQNGLRVKCCKLKDYSASKKFDLVLCCEAITLLDKPQELFDFFQKFSADDSYLVITFVNMDSLIRKIFNFLFTRGSKSEQSVDKYNLELLNEIARKNNLKLVQTVFILQYGFGALGFSAKKHRTLSKLLATNLILSFQKDV